MGSVRLGCARMEGKRGNLAGADEVELQFGSVGDVKRTGAQCIGTGDDERASLDFGGAAVGVRSRQRPTARARLGDAGGSLGDIASQAIADTAADFSAARVGPGCAGFHMAQGQGFAVVARATAGNRNVTGELEQPATPPGGGNADGCSGLAENRAAGGARQPDHAVGGLTGAAVVQGAGAGGGA